MSAEEIDNYEMVSICHLNPEDQARLLLTQKECVFNWCTYSSGVPIQLVHLSIWCTYPSGVPGTTDQWPIGVIMSYIWRRDRVWLTGGAHRHRMAAIRRNPQVSVVITSTGTNLGPGKTVTIKGRCINHEDRETKDWFYPDFALALRGEPAVARKFHEFLDSPLRVVLEVVPEKWITDDGAKVRAHSGGTWIQARSEPRSSPTQCG